MILQIIFLILLIDDGIKIIDLPNKYEDYVKDNNSSYGYINTRGFFINY